MASRISFTIPSKEPDKKQSIRAIRKYKKLIDMTIAVIVSDTSKLSYDGYPRSRIKVNWGHEGEPYWCPKSNTVEKDGVKSYNACRMLIALYEAGYTEYTPNKIFRERQAFLMQLTCMEKSGQVESVL